MKLAVKDRRPAVKPNRETVPVYTYGVFWGADVHTHLTVASLRVCRLILGGNRQSASQPEYDLESENTRQETKCVTWAQSFSHSSRDTDSGGPLREREREKERGIEGEGEREMERGRERQRAGGAGARAAADRLHSGAN